VTGGNAFDVIVEAADTAELTAAGFLVPVIVYASATPNLSGLRTRHGDYVESERAARVDQPKLVGDIVEHWHKLARGRPTVIFATGVRHSVHLRDEFRRSGSVAEHLDGSTPIAERDRILAWLAAREVDLVTNAMVLTEGWDAPDVSCCVLARPTKSFGLYKQMIGRVLRPAPGKIDALLLDHAGAVFMHGLPADPVEWTLREDEKAESILHAQRARRSPAPDRLPGVQGRALCRAAVRRVRLAPGRQTTIDRGNRRRARAVRRCGRADRRRPRRRDAGFTPNWLTSPSSAATRPDGPRTRSERSLAGGPTTGLSTRCRQARQR
jgi:superfamily II DNA or RNA helicase